ncbi:MAG: hypothetical protein IIV88_00110 [Erysipelotrichaceae bacterium]|nr:hypothetical protein [Erysipelotrichaceae bacterium]
MKKFFLLLLFLAAGFLIWHFRLFPQPYYTDADFGITTFVSGHDEDGDGIDDQLDTHSTSSTPTTSGHSPATS